jgi:hypothetical protein
VHWHVADAAPFNIQHMKRIIFSLLLIPVVVLAQTGETTPQSSTSTTTTTANQLPLWRCTLPGGAYQVALRSIVSISSHEYLVDGAARVTEVNIDTQGTALARFYYLEPVTPKSPVGIGDEITRKGQELLIEAADRSGQDAWKKVVKTYPATTHARTVEYRLASKDQLQALFTSVETSWRTGKGVDFSIK